MNPIQYAYMAITTELDVRRHTNKLQRELKRETRVSRKAGNNIERNHENDEDIIATATTTEEIAVAANSSEAIIDNSASQGSEADMIDNPNYIRTIEEPKDENQENTTEIVEEAVVPAQQESVAESTAIPRVEDTHKSGDREVDFSYFHQTKKENEGKEINLNKAAKSVRQAEKDVPPEERSIEGRIYDHIASGAMQYNPYNPYNPNPSTIPVMQQPYMYPSMYPQYFYIPNIPQQPMIQQPVAPTQLPPGFGRHRVDNPPPQEKPKPEKAKAEHCEGVQQIAEVIQDATGSLGVEPKQQNVKFSIFSKYHTPPGNTEEEINKNIQSQNQELKSRYWWLRDIEQIANKNGVSVQFVDSNDGIIFVAAYTKNQEEKFIFNEFKSFIIDYGRRFYDGRIKIFLVTDPDIVIPSMANGFEFIDNSNSNNGEKSLKTDLLEMIFKAGTIIDPASGMYSEKLRQLNMFVDVSSTPTKKMDNKTNDRNEARNRLFASVDAGVFAVAKTYDPFCRFKYYDFDIKSKVFMLVNAATPVEIAILYTPNGAEILTDGIQDAINKYEEAKQKYKSVKIKPTENNKSNNKKG